MQLQRLLNDNTYGISQPGGAIRTESVLFSKPAQPLGYLAYLAVVGGMAWAVLQHLKTMSQGRSGLYALTTAAGAALCYTAVEAVLASQAGVQQHNALVRWILLRDDPNPERNGTKLADQIKGQLGPVQNVWGAQLLASWQAAAGVDELSTVLRGFPRQPEPPIDARVLVDMVGGRGRLPWPEMIVGSVMVLAIMITGSRLLRRHRGARQAGIETVRVWMAREIASAVAAVEAADVRLRKLTGALIQDCDAITSGRPEAGADE
jgi:hypothetical protein